jgi:glycosyltransferase involved in cell wall biosynthesis
MNVFLCRTYIPQLAGMVTIGEGLANEYEKNFGIRPVVITNATAYHEIAPTPVAPGKIRLVYHGIANPSRRLELMIEMMRHLDDRFTLDLILMTSNFASGRTREYIASLHRSAQQDSRISVLPQLPSHEIVPFINRYDVGVFLLPPVNFNYANTLPNKLFEYIQARLAVAVGPTPEMAAIVRKYENGIVADDFSPADLAAKLKSLSVESLTRMKEQSGLAAKELAAEKNKTILLRTVEHIIG